VLSMHVRLFSGQRLPEPNEECRAEILMV
jgi:hypothetical protein